MYLGVFASAARGQSLLFIINLLLKYNATGKYIGVSTGGPTVELVWAKQQTRLPCFVTCITSNISSQLLLAFTSSYALPKLSSEKAFNECLGVSDTFLSAR